MLKPRWARWPCLLLLAWGAVLSLAAAEAISRVPEIRALAPEEAARGLPARITGTVTWTNHLDGIIVQDDGAALWVHVRDARVRKIWQGDDTLVRRVREGARVAVEGVTHAGGYAPVILPTTLTLLGYGPVPPATPVDYERFFAGADAGLRIEVHGVVQGLSEAPGNRWRLLIIGPFGQFGADVARGVVPEPDHLVDAEVRLRGVAASVFNTRGEWIAPRLLTNLPDDLQIEKPAPPRGDVPLVPLDRLHRFSPEVHLPHRVRIEGVVTLVAPRFCYVQEGDRAVRIESKNMPSLTAGERIDALGFVEMTRRMAMLTEADVRTIGRGSVPEPVVISPAEVVALNAAAADRGVPAQPHDFDGHLIRFRATLLAVQNAPQAGTSSHQLVLAQGGAVLSAILFGGNASAFEALRPQSELELTGIAHLDYSSGTPQPGLRPAGLDVILRSADDVVVVQAPSWWTAGRLLILAATIGLILLGALIWVWQLHRVVKQKTHALAAEMHARRDAAIEFDATIRERNRLSANLHDTLLQTMSGLSYQLEACEAEALPAAQRRANHLETARRMVQRGQEDLRGTVWALRVLPLEDGNLADAMRAMAARLSEGRNVTVSVESEGELQPISAFVAGNLLLVAQETMHNALKHARATRIDVRLAVDSTQRQIVLNIRDDGCGFAAEAGKGTSRHFGLPGMRQRIERLDGAFEIESSPEHGTVVRARVPLRSYDEEVA